MKIEYNITEDEFLEVIESVRFKTYPKYQITTALKNTMYMVKVLVNGEFAWIGRVVEDGSIVCMLSDICVKPKFQKQGIGKTIVLELKRMIEEGVKEGEKMQIELTPTLEMKNFIKVVVLNTNLML